MAQPSPSPIRYPAGVSTDFPYGPLADLGVPNPFGYHHFHEDFDTLQTEYTATKTSAGTIAVTPGDGGLLLFTTNASTPLSTDICSLQLPAAGFTFTAGKKSHFLTRIKLSAASASEFIVGKIQTTATPFTVTDGLYFQKLTGTTVITLISMIGSVPTSLTIPASAYTLADNTNIDLGWYVNRNGDVLAFVGGQLVGYLPSAGTGATTPSRGAVGRLTAPSLTTANLNPTLAVRSGTASSKTMTADFWLGSKER